MFIEGLPANDANNDHDDLPHHIDFKSSTVKGLSLNWRTDLEEKRRLHKECVKLEGFKSLFWLYCLFPQLRAFLLFAVACSL